MTRMCATVLAIGVSLASPATAQEVSRGEEVTLAQAVALALSREPLLRAVRADVEMARGMSVQAGLRPNLTTSIERRQEPGGTDDATEVGIEWPLGLSRRGPRIAAAAAEVSVSEYEEADVRRQLVADVSTAYGEAAAAARELSITDDVLTTISKQLELLRARAQQGSVPTLDRDVVDVDVRRIQAERAVQSGRAARALIRLKRLLGMSPDAALRPIQSLEQLVTAEVTVADVTTNPPATRPDVRAAEERVRAADERIGTARSEGKPDVTIFGSYMRMDTGFPQQGFGVDGGLERVRAQFNYVSAGAMVTLPLWNRQQGAVAAATAARAAALARAESARLTAATELADARVRLAQARTAVSLYQDGVRPLARRNFETVSETYSLGRATVFDVLAEQRRYLETERGYTEALSEAFASWVGLQRATGDQR
jgi:outer membrane protein, heavy metal efflux system